MHIIENSDKSLPQDIAEIIGVSQGTIMNIINNTKKKQMLDFYKDFKLLIYNI